MVQYHGVVQRRTVAVGLKPTVKKANCYVRSRNTSTVHSTTARLCLLVRRCREHVLHPPLLPVCPCRLPLSTPATTPSAASTTVPLTPAASSSTAASPAVCTGPVELTDLKLQLQSVLDHSIESDQRLLQFTNEVFTTKPSTSTNSQSRPSLIDQHSQTEYLLPPIYFFPPATPTSSESASPALDSSTPHPPTPLHVYHYYHCYVLIAGNNDLSAGRQDIVFQHMEEVIKNCRICSNLLVSPLPPRYDLPPDNPIHESIALANSYVSELCERYEGVAMMDISDLGLKELTSLPRRRFRTTAPTAPPRSPSAPPSPPPHQPPSITATRRL
ncbi:hypothetical protein J6590_086957 [Homalodisca vitripennis]|nr:hypothetical protein J6590_086957 [Homalodisca vitripennis]